MASKTKPHRELVERRAGFRCEYCHAPKALCAYRFQLEHIIPASKGGSDEPENLALSCFTCNNAKTTHTAGVDPESGHLMPLFNPRTQAWDEHFRWIRHRAIADGGSVPGTETCQWLIEGATPAGRATVATLKMNEPEFFLEARALWFDNGYLL